VLVGIGVQGHVIGVNNKDIGGSFLCATKEKILVTGGMGSMRRTRTWDLMLLYCSFNPCKNCMA